MVGIRWWCGTSELFKKAMEPLTGLMAPRGSLAPCAEVLIASVHFNPQSVEKATSVAWHWVAGCWVRGKCQAGEQGNGRPFLLYTLVPGSGE